MYDGDVFISVFLRCSMFEQQEASTCFLSKRSQLNGWWLVWGDQKKVDKTVDIVATLKKMGNFEENPQFK